MGRLLAAASVAALLLAGGASAATIRGTARGELLRGTAGRDTILAGAGADRVKAQGGGRDSIDCGPGRDIVTVDLTDRVSPSCEVVTRQISADPYRNGNGAQHHTEVEPDSASFGSTVVAAFQVARYFDGGAMNIGWATSHDAGLTWRYGFLPGLTIFSVPGGAPIRASDPSVTYDATHRVWLVSSLVLFVHGTGLYISRSSDGISWSLPVQAAFNSSDSLGYDKEWVTCDNWTTSAFRGNCYLAYSDIGLDQQSVQTSRDGGLTWGPAIGSPDKAGSPIHSEGVGSQPVVRPNGELIDLYLSSRAIRGFRSADGGATFSTEFVLSDVAFDRLPLRAEALPSATVDASGRVTVAWTDCRFHPNCFGDDIVFSTSLDGATWMPASRVPLGPSTGDRFTPGLEAGPAGSVLGLTYYSSGARRCIGGSCRLDAGALTSVDGGATWSAPQRLSSESIPLGWLADTSLGRMPGDYVSTSYAGGRRVSVYALATSARAGLDEAIFATSLPGP